MTYLTLGEVAEYINGRAFKPNEWEDVGLPIIRIQNLTNSTQVINRTSKAFEDKYLVKDGDLSLEMNKHSAMILQYKK